MASASAERYSHIKPLNSRWKDGWLISMTSLGEFEVVQYHGEQPFVIPRAEWDVLSAFPPLNDNPIGFAVGERETNIPAFHGIRDDDRRTENKIVGRRVVQIATNSNQRLYALCDDGTVWVSYNDSKIDSEWNLMQNVPQD